MENVFDPTRILRAIRFEQRFGFNRTSWKTYVADRVKGAFLALLLGTPLLAGILAGLLVGVGVALILGLL